jgi:CBS domain-containing protein
MEMPVFEVLKATVPFNLLNDDILLELSETLEVNGYSKGSYVLRQGKLGPPILFIIIRGVAEVILTDDRNQETSIGIRRSHDFFGITSVLTHKSYPASVRAVEDLTCILLPGKKLEELIISHPTFSGHFTELLSERIRLLYKEVITQHSYEVRSTTESPLLRKRVSDIMTRSPITCHYRTPVVEVASIMKDHLVSSVVVVDDKDYPIGLVGEEDLVHKVLARPSWQTENLVAGFVMGEKLIKLRMEAFYNQALLAVIKHQVKHMVVMDEDKMVGILTLRDLVNTRSAGSLWVTDKIEAAKNLDHLVQIGQEVDYLLNALVAERASVPELFEIITEMHDRLTCRIIELCELDMMKMGYGPPPVDYCWIEMGSAGRKEQTLRTDQDNAIIYAEGDRDHRDYFHVMASRIVEELIHAGFAPCKGDVMASNSKWCHPLNQWKQIINRWMNREDFDSVRMLTILLDFRPVYGSRYLSQELWNHIFEVFQSASGLSHYMTEDELVKPVPLTIMGGFITEKKVPHKNEINLKVVSRHIVNCFRVFAIMKKVTETSTLARISHVVRAGIISREDGDMIQEAFETLMMLQIRENLNKVKQGLGADNYINPYRLNKTEQLLLRGAFSSIYRLQKITREHFTDYARRVLAPGV